MSAASSESEPVRRIANLLGALALAASDAILEDAESLTELGGEAPAALVSIGHEPGRSIDFLARGLRLSHGGAVRLVDRLVAAGLLERRSGKDARTVALFLTEAGLRRRRKLLARREDVLQGAISVLSASQQLQFGAIAEQLLRQLRGPQLERAYTICRLCDDRACGECPMNVD